MPGFDGTGPRGMGPMTGGGRGFCLSGRRLDASYPYRFHRGMGGGYRYRETALPAVPSAPEDLLSSLREEIRSLSEKVDKLASNSKEKPSNS